jgi:hypothetical protein
VTKHTCAFRPEHDLETDEPRGPACGAPATQEIHWRDGRVSPSCAKHGLRALDKAARALVSLITRPKTEAEWVTKE